MAMAMVWGMGIEMEVEKESVMMETKREEHVEMVMAMEKAMSKAM
jgi:hypothetical protein